ncbi:MAG: hypothetical protein JSW07_18690 [bacterium]|nr:MAG: hypothetical protein JSW07_18690 [bacterium]
MNFKFYQRSLYGLILCLLLTWYVESHAQLMIEQVHKRGKLWETISNDGWIGSLGAWDFLVSVPLGLYPGFNGYFHPVGKEGYAVNTYANANFHNFRSGCWIVAKNLLTPSAPPANKPTPTEYEGYMSGMQDDTYGVLSTLFPLELKKNYIENPGFNPLLPEEMTDGFWHTNTGITVTRRSYVWSYPGYCDFIIYDYIFKNTGIMVSNYINEIIPDFPQQELKDVYFVFHSGISVSTKSNINFGSDLPPIHAGGFGWEQGWYHDYFHILDDGELVFSTNYNGGIEPPPWFNLEYIKDDEIWKQKFGDELMSPAVFGWLALYASPTGDQLRPTPKPDVLRVDSHKGGKFQGLALDLEKFRMANYKPKKMFYDFATTPDLQEGLGNEGDRMNFYTISYGPYNLAPDDTVRFILAEIAGVMDYHEVIAGDPNGYFPDSSIAAIRRNAEFARQAVKWGLGKTIDGIPLAADVPEPPPGPHCNAANVSYSNEIPNVEVNWDDIAETTVLTDGSGEIFYDGINDLDGYRIYRSTDFQYVNDTEPPVLRGAAWDLIIDISKSEFPNYWDESSSEYRYMDNDVTFDRRYGYYISAYNLDPKTWTSANSTVVNDLPELASGDYNRTAPVTVASGPVNSFDIYVVPNPFVYNQENRSFGLSDPYKMVFRNLPESCTIRIYTISGDLIATLEHEPDVYGNLSGSEVWYQKSDSGLLVAPGLYVYHIKSNTPDLDRSFTGKLMIIR